MSFLEGVIKMKIGYARVSTKDQRLDCQIERLKREGCERIFQEKESGGKHQRQELMKAISLLRKGDTFVIVKLDRLGRSLKQLIELLETFTSKGIHVNSLDDGINTNSSTGKFFFHVVGAFAELEKELIRERTQSALATAKARGRVGGRPCVYSQETKQAVYDMVKKGIKSVKEIANIFGMNKVTVYRIADSFSTSR